MAMDISYKSSQIVAYADFQYISIASEWFMLLLVEAMLKMVLDDKDNYIISAGRAVKGVNRTDGDR